MEGAREKARARREPGPSSPDTNRNSVLRGSRIQESHGVDCGCAFANFEMELRTRHRPGLAGFRDDVAALDRVAAFHEQLLVMGIGRHPSALVADENEVAIALELITGIRDDPPVGRMNARAFRDRDIDALVAQAVRLRAVLGYDSSFCRPSE